MDLVPLLERGMDRGDCRGLLPAIFGLCSMVQERGTDQSSTTYPSHKNPTDQSHWVLHDPISLTVGVQEYVLGPGDRDYLPASTPH